MLWCGYDNKGAVLVDGQNSYYKSEVAKLARGASSLTNVRLKPRLSSYPGNMQWDGKYITALDQQPGATTINRYVIKANSRIEQGSTRTISVYTLVESWIGPRVRVGKVATRFVVAAAPSGNAVYYWVYPAGGMTVAAIPADNPYGVTVSLAPR